MPDYTLYTYFRSSCSARLRIALNLKGLDYDLVPVNLLKSEQLSEEHRARNPSASVPLLVCHRAGASSGDTKITQSVAALEYLDEAHSDVHPLLPASSDPSRRAVVRALVNVVAADIQPVTNLRIVRRVRALGGDADQWNREFMAEGLGAYEAVAKEWAGEYSVGDQITMADCCLMPAVWNAERYGVDMTAFPTVTRIAARLKEHPAVVKASYFVQPDTPEELREK